MNKINTSSLTFKVIAGMVLGVIVGLIINLGGFNVDGSFANKYLVDGLFHTIGKLFVNALKMIVVPLVFFSLIVGVTGIGNLNKLGRVGGKTICLYFLTTAVAITFSVALAAMLGIGEGVNAVADTSFSGKEAPSFVDVVLSIIPSNPIQAMAQGQMLAVIFFSIMVAMSMLMVGNRAQPLIDGAGLANEVMMKMVQIIMWCAPYAVFALIAKSVADLGIDLMIKLGEYAIVLVLCLMLHLFVVILLILKAFTGVNVITFMKKMRANQLFAFSTSSSNATIPVTLRTVTRRLGVGNSVASFSVPLGATINMDGTAIMQGVATVFIANMFNIDLGVTGYATVVLMAVLASIGSAGVPSAGVIMLTLIFGQLGLPLDGIALILVVDRLLDMIRTAVNITGDAAVSLIVAKSEGEFDIDVFNDPDAGMLDEDDTVAVDLKTE